MLNKLAHMKLELLCNGIRVSEKVLKQFPGYRYKRASLSEGLCFDLFPDDCANTIPINLAIHEKFVSKSPFTYDENRQMILKDNDDFVKATIIDYPTWYSNQLEDGTLFQEVFQIHYHSILATSLTNFCGYKTVGKGCHFCAMGYQVDEHKIKSVDNIVAVLKELLTMGVHLSEVNLNSGTLLDEKKNFNLYLKIIKAIRNETDLPIYAQICPPKDMSLIDQMAEAGISSVSFNMEVYDEDIRKEIMPAKGNIPIDQYFKAMNHATNLLGEMQVSSWLIAGLESNESTIEGIKQIASVGAVPFVTVFRPLTGSEFEDRVPPSPETIAPIFEELGKTLINMKFDPEKTAGGCVKCNCCSALAEVIS